MKKLFAYCRVSSKKQMKDGTMENQRRAIKKFIEYRKDDFEIIKWFEDGGISAIKKRPQYNQMIEELFLNNEIDGMIAQFLDRVGRSIKQLVNLEEKLRENNKILIITDQNIETYTKEGRFQFQMLSAVAEFQRQVIIERMQLGIERYVEDGGKLGRPKKDLEKYKNKIIKLYTKKGIGTKNIAKIISDENMKVSQKTIWDRLNEWGIKMRDIYERKV